MIRLLVAVVACVAVHPSVSPAQARERTVAVDLAGAHHAPPALVGADLSYAPAATAPQLAPPSWLTADAGAPRSFVAVARLWLRAQRLLC